MYGLTIENESLIIEKAKNKGDGCYRFRGVAYRVREGHVTHLAGDGRILERVCGFNAIVGEYDGYIEYAQKMLKSIK